MPVFNGTAGDDTLTGSGSDDTLNGLAGNDILIGGGGADILDGGSGFDTASYQNAIAGIVVDLTTPGNNTGEAAGDTYISIENVRGSAFNDTLTGNAGDNVLRGGLGADLLNGGGGFDFADYRNSTTGITVSLTNPASNTGEAAGDLYASIEGLRGGDFNDLLIGDAGDNFLRGGLGADALNGGGGFDFADYTSATAGVTVSLTDPAINTGEAAGDSYFSIEGVRGSDFNDTLIGDANLNFLRGGLGADTLNGAGGFDYADYRYAIAGITVSLANAAINTGEAAGDTFISIEGLRGSDFGDTLTGDGNDNFLRGGLGADALNGGGGSDYADYFNATTGITASLANPNANTGEAAGDTYVSIENLDGSVFNDTLIGDAGDNVLRGGLGADSLAGGNGDDSADYSNAATGLTASLANPNANTGEAAGDTYSSIENLRGSDFNDTLTGDAGDNVLRGGLGSDALNGGDGFDFADYRNAAAGVTVSLTNPAINTGEAAGDTYVSIEGVRGSQFNDLLIGDAGDNYLRGRNGADVLNGAGGFDYADYSGATAGVVASLTNPALNTGDAAGDTYISIEGLRGTDFNDTLIGDAGDNYLRGRLGADLLNGADGFDYADYRNATTGILASLTNSAINTGDAAGDIYISIEGLRGTDFNDTLIGDANDNFLRGRAGADVLDGAGGFDYADYVNATTAVVASLANPGINTGDAAGDTYVSIEGLRGGDFNDTLTGDAGSNSLRGGLGADALNGGDGIDYADYRNASAGVTVSLANPGANIGEAVGDTYVSIEGLRGGDFNDILTGDAGDNFLRGGQGADVLDGGGGFDLAEYTNATAGVTVSLLTPAGNSGEAAGDTFTSIEGVHGSGFADTLLGDGAVNQLFGLNGNDVLYGFGGNDSINGGAGVDLLTGGAGADALVGGADFDFARYDDSSIGVTVRLDLGTGVGGDAQGDQLVGIEALIGSAFADLLIGDAGSNALLGLGGNDTLYGFAGSDELYGFDGSDMLSGGAAGDRLDGGEGYDFARYDDAAAAVSANLADTTLNAGDAAGDSYFSIEALIGSAFDDRLTGDANANALLGLAGNDALVGLAGNDEIYGFAGNDDLYGGAGADRLDGGNDFDVARYDDAASGVTARLSNAAANAGEAAGDSYFSIEGLAGSHFADILIGDAFNNTLFGNGGDDVLSGFGGADGLVGGQGNDTFVFRLQDLSSGAYAVIADFNEVLGDFDTLFLQGFSNVITAQDGADVLVSTSELGFAGGIRISNFTVGQLSDQFLFG
ncbi:MULTISPECIES: calcium-binding protein [unclassified Bosea (in: a-proteobacteria)]|uniref:beta strand repeat-containing protein n=1 Tax=unclassified Bosea (in: a-proteobacteria) TaxID=2653178 RepID=UPI000F750856|nr:MULTISPECIES: calcium-binding protein [unclassified Bosea (in: a-proteobacteria)]AZO76937.1 hypothetical protein BLM15_04395 [Bosea sp. Tri-49]RXT21774.1 hypothetical protein B5U98_15020 [Bosea sp. Tri-39]RXT32113.1 hypothetical protein B5U99_25865 [Bosea sp. Tri-54]